MCLPCIQPKCKSTMFRCQSNVLWFRLLGTSKHVHNPHGATVFAVDDCKIQDVFRSSGWPDRHLNRILMMPWSGGIPAWRGVESEWHARVSKTPAKDLIALE